MCVVLMVWRCWFAVDVLVCLTCCTTIVRYAISRLFLVDVLICWHQLVESAFFWIFELIVVRQQLHCRCWYWFICSIIFCLPIIKLEVLPCRSFWFSNDYHGWMVFHPSSLCCVFCSWHVEVHWTNRRRPALGACNIVSNSAGIRPHASCYRFQPVGFNGKWSIS